MKHFLYNYTFLLRFLIVVLVYPYRAQTDSLHLLKLETAIEKGQAFLMNLQKPNGVICDTVNPLFELWETTIASGAIQHASGSQRDTVLLKALTYLKTNQNAVGWLCHNQKCKQGYCIETTVAYFRLLARLGQPIQQPIKGLLGLQQPDGAWLIGNPDVNETKKYASVTAFMLVLLQEQHLTHLPSYKKAFEFLSKAQLPQGHWGYAWEYYHCPAYALWPSLQVMLQHNLNTPQKNKALTYCYQAQQANGSWWFYDSLYPKQTSASLQTALMLLGLENDKSKVGQLAISKGIAFLLQAQLSNGSWDGGFFPIKDLRYVKKEYIFATAQAIEVLVRYRTWLKAN